MKFGTKALAGAMACALGMVALPAAAAETIDQSALVGPVPVAPQAGRILFRLGMGSFIGQTVTAGATGLLTRVDVQGFLFNQPNLSGFLTLGLFGGDVTFGAPLIGEVSKNLVFEVPTTASINAPGVVTSFDVASLGYQVTAGRMYSFGFTLTSVPRTTVGFVLGNGSRPDPQAPPVFEYNDYAGGFAVVSNNGGPLNPLFDRDLGFRTFVDTAVGGAVPEPQAWAFLIVGFGGIGMAMRRRRQRLAIA